MSAGVALGLILATLVGARKITRYDASLIPSRIEMSFTDDRGREFDLIGTVIAAVIAIVIATPIGVIGIIYESRPNVTADAGALALNGSLTYAHVYDDALGVKLPRTSRQMSKVAKDCATPVAAVASDHVRNPSAITHFTLYRSTNQPAVKLERMPAKPLATMD